MDARRVSPECGGESGPSEFNSFASPVVKAEDENLFYAPAVSVSVFSVQSFQQHQLAF